MKCKMKRRITLWGGMLALGLVLSAPLTQSVQAAPKTPAVAADPLRETLAADLDLRKKNLPEAESRLLHLLRAYPHNVLRPYWVYELAQFEPQSDRIENYLPQQDPLWPHYYWWRGMRQRQDFCSDDFGRYASEAKMSSVMPSVPDSTEIQERLHCALGLPEQSRLTIARILEQHRYFWLLPRLLKNVKSPEGLFMQGKSALSMRQYRTALNAFATVLQQQDSSGELKKKAVIQAGIAERHLRNPAGAEHWWAWISSQDTQFYPEVLWQKAMLAFAQNQTGEGEHLLTVLIQQYPKHERVAEALEYLLHKALERRDYVSIQKVAAQLILDWPETEVANTARYWLGRSLEHKGQKAEARHWFAKQAKGPLNNYYTQLSLCRLQGVDCFEPRYVTLKAQEPQLDFLQRLPELSILAQRHRSDILEVVAPFTPLTPQQRELLFSYALRYNGNYFRSIRTIWRTQTRDLNTLRLMYPLHYDALQKANAARYHLPQSLIAGLTWQESMYKADIKSSSGATGLMQLMPATARFIAPKAGLPGLSLSQLTDPKINIRLGSYYLHEQLENWDGNLLPMIASYNAGPGAMGRWLKTMPTLDKDEYVEAIPFAETRRYVKQVLTHSRVYEAVYGG